MEGQSSGDVRVVPGPEHLTESQPCTVFCPGLRCDVQGPHRLMTQSYRQREL